MTKSFDAGKLQNFLGNKGWVPDPFFSGREEIQRRLEEKSKIISKNYRKNPGSKPAAGETQVIMGPPDIGKTSLLSKVRLNCISDLNDPSKKHKIIPVMIDDPGSLSFEYLHNRINDTIVELDKEITVAKVKESIQSSLGAITSVSALGVGVGIRETKETKPLVPDNYTVLLMIDEIQSIPPDKSSEVTKVLQRLHTGSNSYPILPVFAGLSNSIAVLQEVNISRFGSGAKQYLQPLSLSEVKESVEKFMEYFHVKAIPVLISNWGNRIFDWADGWPKHVENSMKALGEELLNHNGDLVAVDTHKVKLRAAEFRVDYYDTRFGPFGSAPEIIGEIMAEIGTVSRRGGDIGAIVNKKCKEPYWVDRFVDSDLKKLNFQFLLRYGFIDKVSSTTRLGFRCPIPSLQSYSVATTGFDLHLSAYAGNEADLAESLSEGYDINGVDGWGRTPLHIAAENSWDGITQILLDEGASPQIRDNRNRLPLDLAKTGSYTHELLNKVTDPNHSPANTRNSDDYDNDFSPSPGF